MTNRCNLLCETCPRTFEALEPPADMSWELFTRIVDQVPDIARVVLHGVGEPMLVQALPRMIRYLKDRGIYVLFNTNGTLLHATQVPRARSIPALTSCASRSMPRTARATCKVRGKDLFDRIVRDVGEFTASSSEIGATTPRVSLWLTGLKETVDAAAGFRPPGRAIGVREVHLQRLVFDDIGRGLARPELLAVRADARTTSRRRSTRPRRSAPTSA